LARTYAEVAATAERVGAVVGRLHATVTGPMWQGMSAERFSADLEDFAEDAVKVVNSFGIAEQALTSWAARMETHQAAADRGLAAARTAAEALVPARRTVVGGLRDLLEGAFTSGGSAQRERQEAEERLKAARALVQEAKDAYESDASTAIDLLETAKEKSVPAYGWWEQQVHTEAWHTMVRIAQVAAAAFAVVGLLGAGGKTDPAVAAVVAAAATAAGVQRFLAGEASAGQMAFACAAAATPRGVRDYIPTPPSRVVTYRADLTGLPRHW
jgi:uncharacterized protein YukE